MYTDQHHAGVAVPPQVSPGAQFLRRDGPGQVLGQALQHLAGEVGEIDVVLHEDALRLRLDLSGLAQCLGQAPGGRRGKDGWLALALSFVTQQQFVQRLSPFCKVAVCWPVGDPTYEQGVAVVAWPGDKVLGTVGEGDVDARHPVVHRGEHGERLVGEELEEACCSSGVFLLNNVHNLKEDEQ